MLTMVLGIICLAMYNIVFQKLGLLNADITTKGSAQETDSQTTAQFNEAVQISKSELRTFKEWAKHIKKIEPYYSDLEKIEFSSGFQKKIEELETITDKNIAQKEEEKNVL